MKSPWAEVHPHTGALPTAEAAKSDAVADPRTAPSRPGIAPSLYGKLQTLKGNGFVARFWREKRYSTSVTVTETGESKRLEASSPVDLNEQLLHLQQNLLVRHLQAQVFPEEPREVWVADLTYDDGSSERAEATSYDDLMTTLLSWSGKTSAALLPAPIEHQPLWDTKTTEEAIAVRQFLDVAGRAYKPSAGNCEKILNYLRRHNLATNLKNLVIAFHALNDAGRLEERT